MKLNASRIVLSCLLQAVCLILVFIESVVALLCHLKYSIYLACCACTEIGSVTFLIGQKKIFI
jgi:hypothetical protein